MIEATIEELTYLIKQAKENNQPKPIIFLGAGASKTGGIPLAFEIAEHILEKYKDNPKIKRLDVKQRKYSQLMECLTPYERNALLKKYIEDGKINISHICIAQLIVNGFVDYVLTVNFDNLMLRALALYNEFPPVYDMAILKDLTTSAFKEKSVVYLHGQHHGLWLLNTNEEMNKVDQIIPRIIDPIKNGRSWIFIGYSGNDPIFEHITKIGRFDNGLYWVGHNDEIPNNDVCEQLLDKANTTAFLIKGFDSDSFMLKLSIQLGIKQPSILDRPFTALQGMLDNIVDIEDKEPFKGVKERLEIAKRDVARAIGQFEKGNIGDSIKMKEEINIDLIAKQLIDILVSGKYDEDAINTIEAQVVEYDSRELSNLLADIYYNWGYDLIELAKAKKDENLYRNALEKYSRSASLNPEDGEVYNNLGIVLRSLAELKKDEALYYESIKQYSKSASLNPEDSEVYYNWGIALGDLAKLKKDEALYRESIKQYSKSASLAPEDEVVYNNWGATLCDFAELKKDEVLYRESIKQYSKAVSLNPENGTVYNNWGVTLRSLAELKKDETLYYESIKQYSKSASLNPDDEKVYNNWGVALSDLAKLKNDEELYRESFEKYSKSASLNPEDEKIYNNWGVALSDLAKLKNDEGLYKESFEKYSKSASLNPEGGDAYNNWGNALSCLAQLKNDEGLYKQSFEKYTKSVSLDLENGGTYNNWGIALFSLAELISDEGLYIESIKKYAKSASLNPEDSEVYDNWGNALSSLAQLKSDEKLYKDSFDKYTTSVSLNPKDGSVYNNWGTALSSLAELKSDERLYNESFEKYAKSVSLNPEDGDVYDNWGNVLCKLAKLTNDITLFEESEQKLLKAVRIGYSPYNLACLYAIINQKENALKYLNVTLSSNLETVSFIDTDSDWDSLRADTDFIALLNKYRI